MHPPPVLRLRMTPRVLALLLASGLGLLVGCDAPPTPAAPDTGPRKLVVQGASTSSLDTATTVGLVQEITHWLEYDSALIVRSPSRRLRAPTDAVFEGDVDEVLWIEATGDAGVVTVRWDLVGTAESRHPDFGAQPAIRAELPSIPADLGAAVTTSAGHAWAHQSDRAHAVAGDASAYADFLAQLGALPTADDPRDALRVRIERLEALRPRLSEYPALAYALGSAYLDLAGLVGGTGPYYALAEEELGRAFALDPSDPPVRAKLASFFAKVGRSEESVAVLVDGLVTHPHFPAFHENLGYVLRYAGLMEESMASYLRGQELDSSSGNLVSTQDQITKSLIYLGDYDAALASHRTMLAFAEEGGRSVDEKQWMYEGVIHLYRGDTEAAVHAFRAGARLDPVSVWTTFGHAYEGMALGDTAAVERVLADLERREVVDGERHYRLVHFASFVGDVDRAVDHLRQSTEGGFFNAPYLASDPWTTLLRGHPEAETMIETARLRAEAIAQLMREHR